MKLHLTEEIMLLMLHDDSGEFANVKDWPLRCALAGGLLMDLVLEGRIAAEAQSVRVLDSEPLDAPLLDPALAEMAADDRTRTPRHWVDRFARQADRLRTEALESLVARGILRHDSGLFHWAHGSRRYPVADYMEEAEVKLRLLGVLLDGEEPGLRDIALIHVAHACHILRQLLRHALYERVAKRIEEVCHLDEAGAAVLDAVMDSEVVAGPAHGEPVTEGLPIVGNAYDILFRFRLFMVKQYLELGPVFRVGSLGRAVTVLAGPEANRFVNRHGADYFRSFEVWHEFGYALGGKRIIVSMDGPDHDRLRKALRSAVSRNVAKSRIADIVDITRRQLAAWPTRERIPAAHELPRFMAEMQARIFLNSSMRGYEDDMTGFIDASIIMHVLRSLPRAVAPLQFPKYPRRRARIRELFDGILERRGFRPREDEDPDLLDVLLALHQEDPQFMPERDLHSMMLIPFLAGIDTIGNTLAFMLHALFEDPELMERATAEADALFANGMPTWEDLSGIDVLRRLMMETLRLYPPAFILGRAVTNRFDFGGYRIAPVHNEKKLLIALSVSHYLPEFYPDPYKFDIDRYLPERMEHAHPGAYAPFGLGAHACLGAALGQLQGPLIMATFLHGARWEAAYEKLEVRDRPATRPGKSFAIRIRERR